MTTTATDETQLHPDTRVDGFRLIRLLGRGGMGEVYLALDTQLGRKVALKLVNREHIGTGDAVERFLFEARATAAFNHPNIITVYAAGEYQGRPYVALEYLEGQDLRQRMLEGDLSIRDAMRIGRDIAGALAEAHRHSLLHRDLKPDNVLIADDGLVRVVDFGLAKVVDPLRWGAERPLSTSAGQWVGTPAYMAPEQWLLKPTNTATDVWALGVLLYEVVSGERPYRGSSPEELVELVTSRDPVPPVGRFGDLPAALSELINRCLEKDPSARPSAAEVERTLDGLLHEGGGRLDLERCPFPGLLAFSEEQALFFHGRDAEVLAFVERLRRDAVLPIVGVSGVGKSSFVQAGVIPRLREQRRWLILQLRPGHRPFQTLAERLVDAASATRQGIDAVSTVAARRGSRPLGRRASRPTEPAISDDAQLLASRLRETPGLLALCLRELADLANCRVLLYVDQLEEINALVEDPVERARFTRAVCGAASDAHDPMRVVFTLRDDFLVRLADSAEVRDALRRLTVLRVPTAGALRSALEQPARSVGYGYDDAQLVDDMVRAVQGEAASLPLLQFSARLLWDRRDRQARLLRRASYEEMGGVAGALASHADGVLAGLSREQRELARQLLLRLVTPDGTRRTLSRRLLLEGAERGSADVLERLTESRLVSVHQGAAVDGGAALELVHEALISRWGTLARWVEDSRHERVQLADLEDSAQLWHRRGRRPEETWSGVALEEARRAARRHESRLPELARQFLEAGERREKKRQRRRRLAAGALLVLLLGIAAGSSIVAWVLSAQEQRANRQRRVAERQRAAALREGARAAFKHGHVLEARAKLRLSLESEDSVAGRALWLQLGDEPLQWLRRLPASALGVAFSPDGTRIAVAGQDRVVYILDARTSAPLRLPEHPDQVLGVAFDRSGQALAAGTRSGEIWLWSLADKTRKVLAGHDEAVRRLAFSPDGKLLASASWDGTVRLWTLDGSTEPRVLRGHEDRVFELAFSPDGARLASCSYDRTVRIWSLDAAASPQPRVLRGHVDRVFSVDFSRDGKLLASAGWDRVIRLWDATTGVPVRQLEGHLDGVSSVRFVGDGRLLASSGAGKRVLLWDVASGKLRAALEGHEAGVTGLASDPRGQLLASSGFDKTVRLWDITRTIERLPERGHTDRVNGVAFSPDGTWIASASSDQTVRVWEVQSAREAQVLRGHENGVIDVAFGSRRDVLASAGWDNAIRLWNPAAGRPLRVLLGHEGDIHDLQFTPSGRHLLSASWDRTMRIWNAESGALQAVVQAHEAGVRTLRMSPDGRFVASGEGNTIQLRELESGQIVKELEGHRGTVTSLDFSPDGRLVSGSYDRTVRLWAVHEGVSRVVGTHSARVLSVAFHPRREVIGSAGDEGVARLWDVSAGAVQPLRGHRAAVNSIDFSPDGRLAATCGDDGSVRLWNVDDAAPLWRSTIVETRPPLLRTHRGWNWRGRLAGLPPLERAALVSPAGRSGHCVQTLDSRLEYWQGARRLVDEQLEGLRRVLGAPDGCWALSDAGLVRFSGAGRLGARAGVRAIERAGDGLALATGDMVVLLDARGRERSRWPVEPGVSALLYQDADALIAGFEDGHVAHIGQHAKRKMSFAELPASAVTRFHPGPNDTLVIGFADGEVGLWSRVGGPRLERASLHGPINHLSVHGRKLYATSELGDAWVWDLAPFYRAYCEVMEDVWRAVPVAWQRGMAEEHPAPTRHACRPQPLEPER